MSLARTLWIDHRQKITGGITASLSLIAASGFHPRVIAFASLASGLLTIWFAILHDIAAGKKDAMVAAHMATTDEPGLFSDSGEFIPADELNELEPIPSDTHAPPVIAARGDLPRMCAGCGHWASGVNCVRCGRAFP